MFSDIVFPKDNEKKLINMAIRLGYSTLYLVYDFKQDFNKINETINSLKSFRSIKRYYSNKKYSISIDQPLQPL